MTDHTELTDAVRRVAEAAGIATRISGRVERPGLRYAVPCQCHGKPTHIWRNFPGLRGTLEGECEVIEELLAMAGYNVVILHADDGFGVVLETAAYEADAGDGVGDTLHAALASALLALPGEDAT